MSGSTVPPFEMRIPVRDDDIDELDHVNNVVYLRWVQEAATAHWTAAATPGEQAALLWVVTRHEIDYLKPARLGDEIIARTWVGAATRIRFDRHTELSRASDGALLARARTVWCPVDRTSLRVIAVPASVRARFSQVTNV